MKTLTLALVALVPFCGALNAATPDSLSGLSEQLTAYRDACSKQAASANAEYSSAQYKASLDMDVAATQAKMDARVYAVGHGRRETRDFMLARLQQDQAAQEQQSNRIADKMKADSDSVKACVANAAQEGKAVYSDFRNSHRKADARAAAETLMTAWLTNLEEISFSAPNGSAATNAQWKTAKTHAEITDIQ